MRSGQSANQTPDQATSLTEDESTGRTKVKERPIETALDKKRREKRRLTEELERLKSNGLGERHPARVKITADLKSVEDELIAAGDHTPPDK